MISLTDRYVAAVLQSVPQRCRADIERELRASIADALDARVAHGEAPAVAETAVLTELGDPSHLAAEYAGPPRYLIGPTFFDAYVRTLGVVVAALVPVTWALVMATWLVSGSSIASAVLTASGAAIFVGLLAAFCTTLAYAAVEATPEAPAEVEAAFGVSHRPWTPDRLPAAPLGTRVVKVSESLSSIIGGTIGIALLFAQRSVSPFSDAAGQPIPILHPDLWSFWAPVMVAIAALSVVAEFAMLARGRWELPLALALTVIQLASVTVYIYLLASGRLLNPAFFDKLGAGPWIAAGSPPILLLILLSAIGTAGEVAKLWGAQFGKGRVKS